MDNYSEALEKWIKAKLFRGGKHENDARKLVDFSRPRQRTVRKNTAGDIVFKFHDTDVITWHPNDTFTIRQWSSRTTDEFASPYLPNSMFASFPLVYMDSSRPKKRKDANRWVDKQIIYRLPSSPVRFVQGKYGWVPQDEADVRAFKVVTVDRVAADAALRETNYHQLAAVAQAIMAMQGRTPERLRSFQSYRHETHVPEARLLELLAAGKYTEILDCYGSANRAVTQVREAIYTQARCFKTEMRPWLWRTEYATYRANKRKYGRFA